ncbi:MULTISPECIES: helix-turn-helix transcriptional regulator [unclassified Haloferax]|uniref:helix-turn-helix transcriptional regulator n=1 Tax=unclassified Haloferax TaxID=2625095 RepID=UPI000E23A7FC|nr:MULTISPECIES: helix-turn-helix transcriptional regulator [unclassified Haloferax]RDZ34488.1 hypothetical protein C5B89_18915 [Haloferax sp. Atlit-47N]RDZ34884.1 hypothetical protein C5B88_10650 [Haloferax sp. Atlit-24N]RDZ34890.1 hypothetical protein C5B88_10685 [Haloferax sp. Atlit-24N]RLM35296.1 ArsR family transcriptional regulator [Haloferax sp. Atlit-109R]RLM35302.1 ArsR family transcriptional regulator [Haloferax sp. Atlit-109R]
MRQSATWMTLWDDRILEYIRAEGSGSPKQLKDSGYIHISKAQISRRLRKLAEHDMLTGLGNGVYVISSKGEEYLDGEWDAEADRPVATGGENGENGNGETPAESES